MTRQEIKNDIMKERARLWRLAIQKSPNMTAIAAEIKSTEIELCLKDQLITLLLAPIERRAPQPSLFPIAKRKAEDFQ